MLGSAARSIFLTKKGPPGDQIPCLQHIYIYLYISFLYHVSSSLSLSCEIHCSIATYLPLSLQPLSHSHVSSHSLSCTLSRSFFFSLSLSIYPSLSVNATCHATYTSLSDSADNLKHLRSPWGACATNLQARGAACMEWPLSQQCAHLSALLPRSQQFAFFI